MLNFNVYVGGVLFAANLQDSCKAEVYGCRCVYCITNHLRAQKRTNIQTIRV